jgi:hypothetical protein
VTVVVAADDRNAAFAVLRQRLAEAERRLSLWQASASQCAQAAIFSPRMCEFLKDMATTELTKALMAVDNVDRVCFISCSFPSRDISYTFSTHLGWWPQASPVGAVLISVLE